MMSAEKMERWFGIAVIASLTIFWTGFSVVIADSLLALGSPMFSVVALVVCPAPIVIVALVFVFRRKP